MKRKLCSEFRWPLRRELLGSNVFETLLNFLICSWVLGLIVTILQLSLRSLTFCQLIWRLSCIPRWACSSLSRFYHSNHSIRYNHVGFLNSILAFLLPKYFILTKNLVHGTNYVGTNSHGDSSDSMKFLADLYCHQRSDFFQRAPLVEHLQNYATLRQWGQTQWLPLYNLELKITQGSQSIMYAHGTDFQQSKGHSTNLKPSILTFVKYFVGFYLRKVN